MAGNDLEFDGIHASNPRSAIAELIRRTHAAHEIADDSRRYARRWRRAAVVLTIMGVASLLAGVAIGYNHGKATCNEHHQASR